MEKTNVRSSLTIDDTGRRTGSFEHSWWRILLIVLAIVAFIVTCAFNGLASSGSSGMFYSFQRFKHSFCFCL